MLPTLSNTYLDGDNGAEGHNHTERERERIMKDCRRPEVSSESELCRPVKQAARNQSVTGMGKVSMVTGCSSRSS